ncbi:hypothetical protein VNO80_06783 [Phaseolus coccineus]|uniref:Uncharacterized protein n=1 Tax=Phaseolus coccineus TaxID=3886 RepID=A0AAN9NIC9_PHACN
MHLSPSTLPYTIEKKGKWSQTSSGPPFDGGWKRWRPVVEDVTDSGAAVSVVVLCWWCVAILEVVEWRGVGVGGAGGSVEVWVGHLVALTLASSGGWRRVLGQFEW